MTRPNGTAVTAARNDAPARLADAYLRFMNADPSAIPDAIFAPSFLFWQNTTGRSIDRAAFLARVRALQTIEAFHYADVHLNPFTDGFVQRQEARGVTAQVGRFGVSVCVVAVIENDRITRIFEYFDSAQDPRTAK